MNWSIQIYHGAEHHFHHFWHIIKEVETVGDCENSLQTMMLKGKDGSDLDEGHAWVDMVKNWTHLHVMEKSRCRPGVSL